MPLRSVQRPPGPLAMGPRGLAVQREGTACAHLRGVLKGEHRGHRVVLQVLAVSEGAEALRAEVLRADNCVLLGLKVAPADIQHPGLQQLGPAEREPKGNEGGAREAGELESPARS